MEGYSYIQKKVLPKSLSKSNKLLNLRSVELDDEVKMFDSSLFQKRSDENDVEKLKKKLLQVFF